MEDAFVKAVELFVVKGFANTIGFPEIVVFVPTLPIDKVKSELDVTAVVPSEAIKLHVPETGA